jgi:hypothetical protein
MPAKSATRQKTSRKPLGLMERLAAGPVICAEGYLFEFERRGYLQAGAYVPEVVLEHPQLVEGLHRDFVHAGSDIVEAFTYYAHRAKLKIVGREKDLARIGGVAGSDFMVDVIKTLDIKYCPSNCASSFRAIHDASGVHRLCQTWEMLPAACVGGSSTWGVDEVPSAAVCPIRYALGRRRDHWRCSRSCAGGG